MIILMKKNCYEDDQNDETKILQRWSYQCQKISMKIILGKKYY